MINEKVKLSILITTYNLKAYVRQALDSVLSQEYDDTMEILIGDDGSDDGTLEILKEYEAAHSSLIKLYVRERDPGKKYSRIERSSENRIRLLEDAKGEYCCFLDGDDFYTDDRRLKRMSRILDENPDCSMCAHNLIMYYGPGSEGVLCQAKRERKISIGEYWKLMFLQSGALMFRRGDISDIRGSVLERDYDDNLITFREFLKGKMYYLPECMGAYRQVEGSSWNAMDELEHACVNIVSMGVEYETGKGYERLCDIRHYPDLKKLYRRRGTSDAEVREKYARLSHELGLEISEKVIRRGTGTLLLLRSGAGYYLARIARLFRKLTGRY